MLKFSYSPKVYCWVETAVPIKINNETTRLINLSDYIVSGNVRRVVNAVSTAELTIRNPKKIWTPLKGAVFHPMDKITIFLERIPGIPIQAFTGFIDRSPIYQMYPGTVSIKASCTLKRIQYTFWDPSLPFVFEYLSERGWVSDGNGSLTNWAALGEEGGETKANFNARMENDVARANNEASFNIEEGISVEGGLSIAKAEIQYGETEKLGATAEAKVSSTSNTKGQIVKATIPNLKTNKKYFYRVLAFDEAGSPIYYPTKSFTTESIGAGLELAPKFQLTDSSLTRIIYDILQDVAGWTEESIYVEPIPSGLPQALSKLLKNMAEEESVVYAQLQQFLDRILGAGGYGTGSTGAGHESGGSAGNLKGGEVKERIFFYFTENGFTASQAAGFIGNFQQESGCDPTSLQAGGEGHYLAQWGGSRLTELEAFAKSKKKSVTDLGVQLEFVYHELHGTESGSLASIQKTKTVKEATEIICETYERAGEPMMENRIKYAEEAYKAFVHKIPPVQKEGKTPAGNVEEKKTGGTGSSEYAQPLQNMPKELNVTNEEFGGIQQGVLLLSGKRSEGVYSITPGKLFFRHTKTKLQEGPWEPVVEVSDGPWKGRTVFYKGLQLEKGLKEGQAVVPGQKLGVITYSLPKQKNGFGAVEIGFLEGDHTSTAEKWQEGEQATKDAETMLLELTQLINNGVGIDASELTTANKADIESIATSAAFNTVFAFPSIENMQAALMLTGAKSYANDTSLLPFLQQMTAGCLRQFQSMPNGNLFVFYPDYFGAWGKKPYFEIEDVEILDGKIELNDEALTTHVYVAGDVLVPNSNQASIFDLVVSPGVIDLENVGLGNIIDHGPKEEGPGNVAGSPNFLETPQDVVNFLNRYGVRPLVEKIPVIHSYYYELFMAYQLFQLLWSKQYQTPFTFTFMPELYPGGRVAFPSHGIAMYVDEVYHEFDYTNGFTTQAKLSAPSAFNAQSGTQSPYTEGLIVEQNITSPSTNLGAMTKTGSATAK